MPWKEWNIVEQRLRFIARLLDGEKIYNRYVVSRNWRHLIFYGRRQSPN